VVELPLSFVLSLIWPEHSTNAVSKATLPLALIHGACLIRMNSEGELLARLEHSLKSFTRLIVFEVFTLHLSVELHEPVSASLQKTSDECLQLNYLVHVFLRPSRFRLIFLRMIIEVSNCMDSRLD
jgi:hypothetical protein